MNFTLKAKILIIATAVIVFAIAAVTITSAKLTANTYEEALQSRSQAISKSLTIQLERLLQFGLNIDDIAGFEEQCEEVVKSYSGIEFAFVTNHLGDIVFHSGDSQPPPLQASLISAVQNESEGAILQANQGNTWHYSLMPAYNPQRNHVASVIIAFPAQLVQEKITNTMWIDLAVGFLVLLSGLVILYISLSKYVTTPLTNLMSTVVTLRHFPLDLARRAKVQTADELGKLGKAFNHLMEDLQHTTVSKKELENAMDELQRLSTELVLQKEQVEVTLHSIGDAVISVDNEKLVRYLNPAAERLSGWSLKEADGLTIQTVLHLINTKDNKPIKMPFSEAFAENETFTSTEDAELVRRDGSTIGVDFTASPMHTPEGEINGGVLVLRDVSKERSMAQRLTWEAAHDALTGLVSRREFNIRLDRALHKTQKNQHHHVLCFMDLDSFKVVNDTAGHSAGDKLLKLLSTALLENVRPTDTLARLGGDEFALLLEDCPLGQAEQIANKLLGIVKGFRFEHHGRLFTVGVSIGLAAIDGTANSTELLTMADTACYMAKEQGRNRVCVYNSDNSEAFERRQQAGWVSRITSALDENRLVLYYQKYLSLQEETEKREHIEILIRLRDENNEIVHPDSFLPAAERYGLMPNIDHWVIQKVFSLYKSLFERGGARALTCAINLSGTSLNSQDLLGFIHKQATKYSLPPKAICFEVTETSAINNLASAVEFIQGCKSMGFLFALDDFGTGVSSFSYLKSLPVDYLKIDGSFVKNIVTDKVDRAMTETINRIGQIMEVKTIAEYAEGQSTIDLLKLIGVNYAQGFGIHIPQPLSTIELKDCVKEKI